MSMDPQDFLNRTVQSHCCGAPVISDGICMKCREHCQIDFVEVEPINDEPDYDAPTAKEAQRNNEQIYRDLK